jgi:hypothetical protein
MDSKKKRLPNKGSFQKGHKGNVGNKYRVGIPAWNKGLTKANSNTKGGRTFGAKDKIKRIIKNPHNIKGKDHWLYGVQPANYKGEKAGYTSKHQWVARHYGQPTMCEHCQTNNLIGHQINWANISGEYKRDRTDWVRLCVKCHRLFDKDKKHD